MGKSVSNDLRQRMVRAIAAGKSRRAVAPSTAVRVQARYAATGSVAPARQGRPKGSGKLAPYRKAIVDKVKAQPDITIHHNIQLCRAHPSNELVQILVFLHRL